MAFRLAAFYFLFFAYAGAYVAYFPLYLASRKLSAVEIAGVLALPAIARIVVPTAWGSVADRTGAHRAIVASSCAVTALGFALLPFTEREERWRDVGGGLGVAEVAADGPHVPDGRRRHPTA